MNSKLDHNKISRIENQAFVGLAKLEYLYVITYSLQAKSLIFKSIEKTEWYSSSSFLINRDISDNNIISLNGIFVQGLKNLKSLYVIYHRIVYKLLY